MTEKTLFKNMEASISLLSGAFMNYEKPEECECTIEDIATALSNVCRFAGHLPRFYSVAQHLVNTSLIVPEEHAYTALMHDTAEAFTNDLPTPLKWAFPVFKELEVKIEEAMSARFEFQFPYPDEVKDADLKMLKIEKELVKKDPARWEMLDGVRIKHLIPLVHLEQWTPEQAKEAFLDRYYTLRFREGMKNAHEGPRPETAAA